MRGGYTHIPFVNVLDPLDVAAFFGNSPCAAVNDKDMNEREEACNSVTSAGQFGCLYDAKVGMCQPFKNAFRQVLKERASSGEAAYEEPYDDLELSLGALAPRVSVTQLLNQVQQLARKYLASGRVDPRARVRVQIAHDLMLADPDQAVLLIAELEQLAKETRHEVLVDFVKVAQRLLRG